MNELQLSNDLPVIESELKVFKEMNGYSMYEIGRRLKHVKENDLVHGQWIEWLEKVDIHPREAQRFIKIVSDPQLKTTTWSHLGSRTLYEITGVPIEEREKKHLTEKGEEKTVDEMTVKEIQDLKRQLKQRDEQNAQLQSQVEQAQRSEEIAKKQLEDAESREPEVIEKYMEPEDYQSIKNMNEHLESEREYYKNLADDFRNEVKDMMDQPSNAATFTKENDNQDYTPILLKILEPSELFIQNYKNHINEQEVINKLEEIIKKLKEQ